MYSRLLQICVLVTAAILLGLGLNAMRPNPLPWHYTPSPPASAVGPNVPAPGTGLIGLDELRRAAPDAVLIVDARPPLFYRKSHIPGAINIAKEYLPRDFLTMEPLLRKASAKQLIVYCAHEECEDAQTVANELARLGLPRVFVFKGGWRAWQAAGLPEENG